MINSFQDVNDIFTEVSSPNILVNYSQKNAFEYGVLYRRKFENKFGWGTGLGCRKTNYNVDVATVDYWTDETGYNYEDAVEAHFINLDINGTKLALTTNLRL